VRWITQLPRFRNENSKSGAITYVGPILAGGRLLVAASNGAIMSVEPTTGAVQDQIVIKASISLAPAVANSTLYLLGDDGRLRAFR
jgi:outer membrane protein assembly factor BamB